MRQPGRHKASGGAAIGRLARLCALVAILIYQPLAALHFATDEAHLLKAAASFQVAALGGDAHGRTGHSHPDHADDLCDFCILAGASLPPLPAAPAHGAAEPSRASQPPSGTVRADKRLRVGHPVRAPPRTV